MGKSNETNCSSVVVLGMHRSGTSLLASMIEKLGYWFADDTEAMEPRDDNPQGFWERQDVVDLNDQILAKHGEAWHSVYSGFDATTTVDLKSEYGNAVKTILERLNNNKRWLIKDPRMCLTWAYWAPYLVNSKLVVIVRHPLEVAHSLKARNSLPLSLGLELWLRYVVSVAHILDSRDYFHTTYRELLDVPAQKIRQLSEFLEIDALDGINVLAMEAENLVEKNLTHHNNYDLELKENHPELFKIWERVNIGNYRGISRPNLVSQSFKAHELYEVWSNLYGLHQQYLARTNESEVLKNESEVLRNKNEVLRKENEVLRNENEVLSAEKAEFRTYIDAREAQQDCIAESLVALKFSKSYRIGRLSTGMLRKIFGKSEPDAIDKMLTILEEQGYRNIKKRPDSQILDLLKYMVLHPTDIFKEVSISRMRVLWRHVTDSDARSRLPLLVSRYREGMQNSQLELILPGSVNAVDIRLTPVENPKASIIIPVYNQLESTLACIKSVVDHCHGESYEIIVADDCSQDDTKNLEKKIENLIVARPKNNQGFLGNCKHAIHSARGEYLVFLNNDTNVQKNWLQELISVLEGDASVGLVGSKLVYPDGQLQEAGGIIFSDGSGWNYGRFSDPQLPEFNYVREVDYISGASIALRRDMWERLGGFDERFKPAYYEDTDLCFQIRKSGYKVIYNPFSVAVHYEGVTHGTDEESGVKQYQVQNREIFLRKWEQVLKQQHYRDSRDLFFARQHGKDQRIVLMVDHYVPMHDKDAGSRSTRKYIELLIDEGLRVIFIGDNFYPHQPYTEELQRLGVEVLYGQYYKKHWASWFKGNAKYIDCVYIHRPHVAEKYLFTMRQISPDTRIVYFGHDLHFLRAQREGEISEDRGKIKEAEEWNEKEFKIMRAADLSLFPAAYEAETVLGIDPTINVDHIPLYWFDENELTSFIEPSEQHNLLFVGGFGHPPNLDGLLWFIDSIWPVIIEQSKLANLTIIGSKCPQAVHDLQCDRIKVLGEVSDDVLENSYKCASVVIVPLRYGAGVKGKVLEAMSKAVPVCTTTVGVEGLPELQESYLRVADDSSVFADNVIKLLESPGERERLSARATDVLRLNFGRDKARSSIMGCLMIGNN